MEEIKIIKNEEDYNVAVARVEQLLLAPNHHGVMMKAL